MYVLAVTSHCHFLAATSKTQLKHAGHLPNPYATPSQQCMLYITCCTLHAEHMSKITLTAERQSYLAPEEKREKTR